MTALKRIASVCVLLTFPQAAPAAPQWTALFNGKNLDNFDIAYSSKPVDSRPASAMFEVKDGVVHTYPGRPQVRPSLPPISRQRTSIPISSCTWNTNGGSRNLRPVCSG